jgi:hypothetical protein
MFAGPVEDVTEEGVVGHLAGQGHRDGAQGVDLAQFTCFGPPPLQGLGVHPDHH